MERKFRKKVWIRKAWIFCKIKAYKIEFYLIVDEILANESLDKVFCVVLVELVLIVVLIGVDEVLDVLVVLRFVVVVVSVK